MPCIKSCSPTESGRSKSCPAKISNEKVVCAAQLFKNGGRKLHVRPNFQKRLPALIKKASVGQTTRTTSASHLGNKNAPWGSYVALRNATATVIVATATTPPNSVRETTTTILQRNSNNKIFLRQQQKQPHARTPKEQSCTVDASVAENSRAVSSWNLNIVAVSLVSGSHLCDAEV